MRLVVLVAAVGLVGAATAVEAAIQWTATSNLAVSVTPPPVKLALGGGASKTRYFSPPLTLSANETIVSGTLSAKAGADLRVKDVVRTVEARGSSQSVTLAATQVTNPKIELWTWTVKDGLTTIASLDARSATPTASFTLPSGASYKVELRVDVQDGAGKNDSPTSFDLRLVIG